MPMVSVIVPVYNAEKTIVRCLDSIISQTFKDIEIIIVNDGSNDGSQMICEKYCDRYSEIRLINQDNAGPATARNTGIDYAAGKYIAFIDSDDYAEDNMIEEMVKAVEGNQAEMVICGYYQEIAGVITEHKFDYNSGLYEDDHLKKIAIDLISNVSDTRIPPYSWVRMILRDALENPRLRYAAGMVRSEDYYLFVQLHFRVNRLYLLTDKPLYHYMEQERSVTHSYVSRYWDSVKEIYMGLKQNLPKKKEIEDRLNIMLIQRSLIALNNSSRCKSKKLFKEEIEEITRDGILNTVIQRLSPKEGYKRFGIYYVLMKARAYFFVYDRYLIKFYKYKS